MFTIDSEARVTPYSVSALETEDSGTCIHNEVDLNALIGSRPGEWAVRLWNQLPGVTPIHTPPGEPSAKFRNKQTAVERIWKKLCELFPAAVVHPEVLPRPKRSKLKEVYATADFKKALEAEDAITEDVSKETKAKAKVRRAANGNGKKSAWAEELTEELRKRYAAGDDFELADVYKLIPVFQRKHKDNHHVAARLRTTLAQDLRGNGIVKSVGSGRGRYRMLAAK